MVDITLTVGHKNSVIFHRPLLIWTCVPDSIFMGSGLRDEVNGSLWSIW